ncbi:RHS repeat-associated core domain-containing protein [Chitinophaga sp. 212800008-4]|uniref:RHS repeat domain-containing protein n=1 Tax=Chitinophaga sp. 212800008-4 TaxID=3108349 RepID=UPI0030CA9DC4
MKGEGNEQDYGMRVYDPCVGRFLSVDPLFPKYPMLTPYQFASNRPIDRIDVDGLEFGNSFDAKSSLYIGNLFLSEDKKLNREELEARGNAYNNGLRTGYAIGALISIDLYTGGRLSQLSLAGAVLGIKQLQPLRGELLRLSLQEMLLWRWKLDM